MSKYYHVNWDLDKKDFETKEEIVNYLAKIWNEKLTNDERDFYLKENKDMFILDVHYVKPLKMFIPIADGCYYIHNE